MQYSSRLLDGLAFCITLYDLSSAAPACHRLQKAAPIAHTTFFRCMDLAVEWLDWITNLPQTTLVWSSKHRICPGRLPCLEFTEIRATTEPPHRD